MRGTITSVKNQESKYGGNVYLVTFSCEDNKSRRSWIDPGNRNFTRWKKIIEKGTGAVVGNLNTKDEFLIDADSFPEVIE